MLKWMLGVGKARLGGSDFDRKLSYHKPQPLPNWPWQR